MTIDKERKTFVTHLILVLVLFTEKLTRDFLTSCLHMLHMWIQMYEAFCSSRGSVWRLINCLRWHLETEDYKFENVKKSGCVELEVSLTELHSLPFISAWGYSTSITLQILCLELLALSCILGNVGTRCDKEGCKVKQNISSCFFHTSGSLARLDLLDLCVWKCDAERWNQGAHYTNPQVSIFQHRYAALSPRKTAYKNRLQWSEKCFQLIHRWIQ